MTLLQWSWILFGTNLLMFIAAYYVSMSKATMSVMLPLAIAWIANNTALILFAWNTELWGFLAIASLNIFSILISTFNIKKETDNGNIKL